MIWCVEDDPSIREIMVYALNSTGLEAYGFEDGQIFWDILQEKQPDLILLDVMLPGIDGIELLTRMKGTERFREIPVIMATAKGTEFDKVQSLDLGADDYLVKPFGMMACGTTSPARWATGSTSTIPTSPSPTTTSRPCGSF